ncbi:hypothetical protein EGW08_020033 [Elysia chlorotica]|uniref:G-protein coupled receptors family 1 profile domain-containing protein n=1 Tax=Elysia chlorotica TaxID=188477 RepID=A0A433SSJ2_ELYCH|nr:hypothetical protein EGW08_020033 [Elysia chlorotica]
MDHNNNNQTNELSVISPLVSSAVLDIFLLVVNFALCCSISLVGVFTNLANIVVYTKMGFSETSNINFLALSVFDLLVSLAAFVSKVFYSLFLRGVNIIPMLNVVTSMLTYIMFVAIGGSAMTTALISMERCLCVVFPLQMKTIMTQRRILVLVMSIVIYHALFIILLFTDTGFAYASYSSKIGFYYFSLYAVPSTTCFFIVLLTTIAMVIRLNKSLQWRKETSQQRGRSSDKEGRIARTIIAISTIFIVCFFPNVANFLTQAAYPAYSYDNAYLWSLRTVIFTFTGLLQAISSSINILFYYKMSSRYKKAFSDCFNLKKRFCVQQNTS